MDSSIFQGIKRELLELTMLSKDAIHIYIGMVVFLSWNILFKKSFNSLKALIPVFSVALILEIFDIRDNYMSTGSMHITASLHDIINTCFWPFVLVILEKSGIMERSKRL
ncbi:MAG: hypothetical protein EH225_11925 [Calditrichaeota bacterium]|nr:hypothetical protein [Calditrichota bacterium]RQV99230.1 MAG: hypothetical protein EH225_11925 [Calditrichota bacterium]